ncbi:MAG: hypothetical protein HW417_1861 [Steroidobacteraceae bacterium]|nr:hypothetical protein [Steroidobacteraceae bacterium]MBM2854933.1 hypothetical protein [Steroidobacteraceae bacterium]
MNRRAWLAAGLLALPAAAAEPPPQPDPDPEFLEFLAETAGEDEEFADYVESRNFERELRKVEEQRADAKGEDHEP